MENNSVTPQPKKTQQKPKQQKKIAKPQPNAFKQKYFEFYDDVKCETRKRQDW